MNSSLNGLRLYVSSNHAADERETIRDSGLLFITGRMQHLSGYYCYTIPLLVVF